ncbi:hypothetical protein U0070_022150 [Myodes glareolus]|uniref:Uncharacterized protein n=1 Tax=Myodes glareolus TaxID=447135 RepID=A0AAW0I7U2_MYOGA
MGWNQLHGTNSYGYAHVAKPLVISHANSHGSKPRSQSVKPPREYMCSQRSEEGSRVLELELHAVTSPLTSEKKIFKRRQKETNNLQTNWLLLRPRLNRKADCCRQRTGCEPHCLTMPSSRLVYSPVVQALRDSRTRNSTEGTVLITNWGIHPALYSTREQQPRGGSVHSELGPPISIIKQENAPQTCPQTNLYPEKSEEASRSLELELHKAVSRRTRILYRTIEMKLGLALLQPGSMLMSEVPVTIHGHVDA